MPIILDYQLREQIPHNTTEFPVTFYHDELVTLPDKTGPLHWHPDFEIASAVTGVLDYQVGQQHITLEAGDSIFINKNILHGVKQVSGDSPDSMPNIVFSGTVPASENSAIYQKYILPVMPCDSLPFVVFRHEDISYKDINCLIHDTYRQLSEKPTCYEMAVQRNISRIFEYIFCNIDNFPKSETTRIQIRNQTRIQKMLDYIYEHYNEAVTLSDIANAADISRSEAGRCFKTYMGCSPVDALIRYRLQTAHRLLNEKSLTLQEVSFACGFNSVNYFSRQFKKIYGYAPGKKMTLGK